MCKRPVELTCLEKLSMSTVQEAQPRLIAGGTASTTKQTDVTKYQCCSSANTQTQKTCTVQEASPQPVAGGAASTTKQIPQALFRCLFRLLRTQPLNTQHAAQLCDHCTRQRCGTHYLWRASPHTTTEMRHGRLSLPGVGQYTALCRYG